MPIILARQGETVDQIAARCYSGDTSMAAAILTANPGLSALGLCLPHGTEVTLPEKAKSSPPPILSLWD